MNNLERTVTAVLMKREDAVSEIQRLHNQGYRQFEISVYSNPERAKTVERLMGIEVENVDIHYVAEDTSWWESIKHSFRFFVYETDDGADHVRLVDETNRHLDNSQTIDLLSPYKKDLASGKLVIVVDNYGSHSHP